MSYEATLKQFMEAARKRREKARKLRKQGLTYKAIGDELGVTHQRARQMVVSDGSKASSR